MYSMRGHAFCHMVGAPFCKGSWPSSPGRTSCPSPCFCPRRGQSPGRWEVSAAQKLPLQCPYEARFESRIVYLCHICTGRGSPKCSLPVCATCLAASRPAGVRRVRMSTFYLPVRAAQCLTLQALPNRFYAVCRVCDLSYAG